MIPRPLALMRRILGTFIIISALVFLALRAWADAEIVIAIRYLQAEGTSHSHLYLYREDGKLLRQLTNDNSAQDSAPIFASDGASIVFTREKSGTREFWSIDPLGKTLKKFETAPNWYTSAKNSPYFTNVEPEESASTSPSVSPAESASPATTPTPIYKSPDGFVELILRLDVNDEDDQINGPGHGKHYLLGDLKTGTETQFEKLPGFYGVLGLLHENEDKDQHFLFDGALRLAFFDLHLNSTDGDTVFALDLTGPRLVRLSPNWATPIPLPGEPAFLTFTENRYVPIPGSQETANCSYMEHWDDKLNKIRYARDKSAALCYGASMYRPGKNPSVITVRRGAE
jgi:hypothetical protein